MNGEDKVGMCYEKEAILIGNGWKERWVEFLDGGG